MSAPTSANPHMNEPHTETSRRRLAVGAEATAVCSATGISDPPEQRKPEARESEIPNDRKPGDSHEPLTNHGRAHETRRSRRTVRRFDVVYGGPMPQAEVAPEGQPPHQPGRHDLAFGSVQVVEEFRAEHQVKRLLQILHANVELPDVHAWITCKALPGSTNGQGGEVNGNEVPALIHQTGRKDALPAPDFDGGRIVAFLEDAQGGLRPVAFVRRGCEP